MIIVMIRKVYHEPCPCQHVAGLPQITMEEMVTIYVV